MQPPDTLYRLHVTLKARPDEEQLALLLAELVPWGWEEREQGEGAELLLHCHSLEHLERVRQRLLTGLPQAKARIEKAVVEPWDRAWRSYFKPKLVAEKFLVLPAWEESLEIDSELIPISIEPKMAFGTGHHETTALCLESVATLWSRKRLFPGEAFLDLGTGSGILGIACSLLGLKGLGLDVDPVAVSNALENAALNRVQDRFALAVGGLECLAPGQQFDLMLANILAEPLLAMAPFLVEHLRAQGSLILSGFLRDQEASVFRAYQEHGLERYSVLRQSEWSAMILKPARARIQ